MKRSKTLPKISRNKNSKTYYFESEYIRKYQDKPIFVNIKPGRQYLDGTTQLSLV